MTVAYRRTARRARVSRATVSRPRLMPTKPVTKRSRWRTRRAVTANRAAKKGYAPPPRRDASGAPRVGSLKITGGFSGRALRRPVAITAGSRANQVPDELLDRWAAIEAGMMPADEAMPAPPTEDELNEAEAEALRELEIQARARDEAIIDGDQSAAFQARADAARQSDREAEAQAWEADAEEESWRVHRELEASAAQFSEDVEDARKALFDDAHAKLDAWNERLDELKTGLHAEVEAGLRATYFRSAGDFDLDTFELS